MGRAESNYGPAGPTFAVDTEEEVQAIHRKARMIVVQVDLRCSSIAMVSDVRNTLAK